MGLSFGPLAENPHLFRSKKKKRTAFQWIRIQSTFARISHSDFRNLGLFTSGEWWQNAPSWEGLSESTWVILIPYASFFFIFAWLDFLLCFVLHSCKMSLLPAQPLLTRMYTHIHIQSHTQRCTCSDKSHRPGGKVKGHLHNGFSRIIWCNE